MTRPSERVIRVLEAYVSPINARGAVSRALQRLGASESDFTESQAAQLFDALQPALRLYLDTTQQAELTQRLREEFKLGSSPAPQRLIIRTEEDVSRARTLARALCLQLGARSFVLQRVATVVSELARNIVQYAGSGSIELEPLEKQAAMRVRAEDQGAGIPNLDTILSGGYRSKTGLGLGLLGCKRMSDRFHIETGAGGTRIDLEIRL